jgi:hypothetical protein
MRNIMNKLLCGLLGGLLYVSIGYSGAPLVYTLSTNSVEILPAKPIQPHLANWATNTVYTQGVLVQNLEAYYFAMNAGTSSNAGAGPSFRSTTGADNDITWVQVPRGNRTGLCVVNGSIDDVYLSIGLPAVAGSGIKLIPNSGPFLLQGYNGAVYAISTNTSSALTVQDW